MSRTLVTKLPLVPRLDLPPLRVADFRHGANLFAFRSRLRRRKRSAGTPQTRKLEASLPPRQKAPVQTGARTTRLPQQHGSEARACEYRKTQVRENETKIQAEIRSTHHRKHRPCKAP